VFGGTSAGGSSAIPYLDHVANTLKQRNVSVLGYLDSPMVYDRDAYDPKFVGLNKQFKIAFNGLSE